MSKDEKAEWPPQKQNLEQAPRCPSCGARTRLRNVILDTVNGRPIRVHQCKCGEVIWE